MALKITLYTDYARQELETTCALTRNEIVQRATPCFLKLKQWYLCTDVPPMWRVREPPAVYRARWHKDPLLYLSSELAQTTLQSAIDDNILSVDDVTSIYFECLVALAAARMSLKFNHGDLKPDNILLRSNNRGRHYVIDTSNSFWISSPYQPEIADFGFSSTHVTVTSTDSALLSETIAESLNELPDLTDETAALYDETLSVFVTSQLDTSTNANIIFDALTKTNLFSTYFGRPSKSMSSYDSFSLSRTHAEHV